MICMELNCPDDSCPFATDSDMGMKVHWGQKHEGPFPFNVKECPGCGKEFDARHGKKYCSHECYSVDSEGENKGFGSEEADYRDEEWLEEKLADEGMSVFDVADMCDVQVETIRKWKDKHEIGLDYECPSCDKKFSSRRGRNAHHTQVHGESIRGTEYECQKCGEEFSSARTEDHNSPPQYCSIECRNTGRQTHEVEETGHVVDSEWEEEVDLLLHEMGMEYHYNTSEEFPVFELESGSYKPDFWIPSVVKDIVIEVKGGMGYIWNEEKCERIAQEMTEDESIVYVVYGDVELECDVFIEKDDLTGLKSFIEKNI